MQYIVGIDLGTTNCAVAYVSAAELKKPQPKLHPFKIPQLTRLGAVEARELLPSFVYLPGPKELPAGSMALPWDSKNIVIVGELARNLGAKVPGRLVSSAKSWLCSPSVDRTAAILPWGAPQDVKRVSPVDASALYLKHIRDAWDHEMAEGDKEKSLANQDVVITVPASFDEAARELTVAAAKQAGLTRITLLEEPQAAFYAWIAKHAKSLKKELAGIGRVLVCDIGGGTTDFSLIEVKFPDAAKQRLELTRVAVGDHLMLGGDNMDLTLARQLEKKLSAPLDAHQFKALTASAREAKEQLYSSAHPPAKLPVTVVGRGSSVVGGSLRTELTAGDADQLLVDGFFPASRFADDPQTAGRGGIKEWGLPYVHDPAVTRHLSQFLRHHLRGDAASVRPDAVLFNGGGVKPAVFRERLLNIIGTWFNDGKNWTPHELSGTSLDLAVAEGAAYYGCVRHGTGLRIGGGMARAYYIGIEIDPTPQIPDGKAAICLVPHGTEEGDELELPQNFILRLATPVVFPLFSSSVRTDDELGQVIDERSSELQPLPPLETILHSGRHAVKKDVTVHLQAGLTEVGTLALALKSVSDDRTWEVHLNVRSKTGSTQSVAAAQTDTPADAGFGADPRKVEAAVALINRAFNPQSREPLPITLLTKQLEGALGMSKEAWPAPLARRLADAALDFSSARTRSAEHEARWLNLCGFLLRPGFGFLADAERLKRLYNATRDGLAFVSDPNCRIEWWVLWRRIAAGLKEDQERELYNRLQPFLTNDRDIKKRGGWPRPTKGEIPEMWRAAASLELLDTNQKKLLASHLLDALQDEGPTTPLLWALGRLGARQPAHAAANYAVPPELAQEWLKELLNLPWQNNPMANFAAVSLARKTGDRVRDIPDPLRLRTIEKLKKSGATDHEIESVKRVTELESNDRKLIFGDVLPAALRLEESPD